MRWLGVRITAARVPSGRSIASERGGGFREESHSATAASTFHPKCKLGTAAYSLRRNAGLATLLTPYWLKTVPVKPNSGRNRGGATGKVAYTTSPMAPDMRTALRISRYWGRCQKYSQTATTKIIGRWPYRYMPFRASTSQPWGRIASGGGSPQKIPKPLSRP